MRHNGVTCVWGSLVDTHYVRKDFPNMGRDQPQAKALGFVDSCVLAPGVCSRTPGQSSQASCFEQRTRPCI